MTLASAWPEAVETSESVGSLSGKNYFRCSFDAPELAAAVVAFLQGTLQVGTDQAEACPVSRRRPLKMTQVQEVGRPAVWAGVEPLLARAPLVGALRLEQRGFELGLPRTGCSRCSPSARRTKEMKMFWSSRSRPRTLF